MPPPLGVAAKADDISALERNVAEHPNDEGYRKLLAVALHDDAMKDWWEDPEDKSLLCVSKEGLDDARTQLMRANHLKRSFLSANQRLLVPLQKPCSKCPLPPPVEVPPRCLPPERVDGHALSAGGPGNSAALAQ